MATIKSGIDSIARAFAPAAKPAQTGLGKMLGDLGKVWGFRHVGALLKGAGNVVAHIIFPWKWPGLITGVTSWASGKASMAVAGATAKASTKGVWWLVQQPVAYALHGTGWVMQAARKHPIPAAIVGAVAVAGTWAGLARGKAERRTQQELLNQAVAAQQGQNPYQISAEDAAALEARLKQGGGFAQAQLAARSGAQEQAAVR